MAYDRFHQWDEDLLREEMEAAPPSIVKVRRVTRVDKIIDALDTETPRTGLQIAEIIDDTPNAVFSTMSAIRKSGRAARVYLEDGQVAWLKAVSA